MILKIVLILWSYNVAYTNDAKKKMGTQNLRTKLKFFLGYFEQYVI